MRLLLAEDEKSLARAVSAILEKNNFSVDVVHDGADALDWLRAGNYDGAVLDIMMPKMDGIPVLKTIRAEGNMLPVLLLTAKSEIDDKVEGLDSGANDYLTKPFAAKELLARIRAMTRTATAQPSSTLQFGNLTLDRATFELKSPSGSFRLGRRLRLGLPFRPDARLPRLHREGRGDVIFFVSEALRLREGAAVGGENVQNLVRVLHDVAVGKVIRRAEDHAEDEQQ